MLQRRDIIVFSDDWGRHPSSCQHLMRHFLPDNRIVWVNTIGMRSPRLSLYDIKRGLGKVGGWLAGTSRPAARVASGPEVVDPVIIPFNHIGPVRSLNRELVLRTLRPLLKRQGISDPIVVTTFPCAVDYLGALGEALSVYYCVDDFTRWPGVNRQLIVAMEEELLAASDLVLASSDTLCVSKARGATGPLLLPHGVDFDHFAVPRRSGQAPEPLAALPGPIIGFFGAVSEWIDFELIAELARRRRSWSFAFIGPVDTDIERLKGGENIHFLGPVSYGQLPSWAAFFDVALVPFVVNELTVSVNPLKLLEYLALGLPVVAADLPEIRKFSDIVAVAEGPDDSLRAIEKALAEDTKDLAERRRERARAHSWRAAAELMSGYIEALLGRRAATSSRRSGERQCGGHSG